LIASWQAVVRGLLRDENDNARAVQVVEHVKSVTRLTGVPWLIDAHSGKGEDQSDHADPSRALRGASGAAAAADYTLSLRYASSPFTTQRRLAGKGRFVSVAPITLDFDDTTGTYSVVAAATKTATIETTWKLLMETGAVTATPRDATTIARAAGLVSPAGTVTSTHRRQVHDALTARDGVRQTTERRRGQSTTVYTWTDGE
jgi:hypothetical protein